MRKKILAIVFAALLAMGMAVPAFAEDEQSEDQEAGEQANVEQGVQNEE